MAFVSQLGKYQKRNGRRPGFRFVSFRKLKSGATGGMVTKDTGLRGTKIDIQIDAETKTIRLGKSENGVKVNQQWGSFACSSSVLNAVGKGRISLTDGGDGWWYGSYAEGANQ
ncbi:TPA: hypothetical protein MG803_21115 [Klebsiella pneumoniae]|nr:hypothetical protein [Klebsiella pneumoniae]HBY1126533.1 hypothetical protein [Klebsiella pneumoniae]HBY2179453.1 hypothetical protein [Klebsiella pneumoniae]HBY2224149.1 hypothetical protein [Klebsiella pneumoniae]HBZ2232701.1 hypothetical protein [Klebsiella pneumoniae]